MTPLDPESRRLLALARAARTPSVADKARVAEQLTHALGGPALTAAPAAAATKLAGGLSVLKWWLVAGVVVVGAASRYLDRPAALQQLPAQQPPAAATKLAYPPPIAAVEHGASEAPTAASEPPALPHASKALRHAHTRAEPKGHALERELELLHAAQIAWRDRKAQRALTLLQQHRALYPRSELRSEREGLQVLTLCELGRSMEAAHLARSLLTRAPESRYEPRSSRAVQLRACEATAAEPRPRAARHSARSAPLE